MKKIFLLIALMIGLLSLNAQTRVGVIFYDDCEASNKPILGGTNHNITNSWGSRQGSSTNSYVQRSNEVPARLGTYSYKHNLTNSTNDGWQYMKAELAWNFLPAGSPLGTVGDQTAYYRAPAGMRWFAASTYIPNYNTDYNTITSILFNTKPVEDEGFTTPTYLSMELGRYQFFITRFTGRTQVGSNSYGPIYSYTTSVQKVDCGPVIKDKWEDWVMNRNFTFSPDSGYVRLYKNDTLVAQWLGGNWPEDPQHSKEPYIQNGLYKWAFGNNWSPTPNTNTVTMFMDEIRVGGFNSNLASMKPEFSTPTNTPPVVSAGSSKTVSSGTTSTSLTGTASDPGGSIASTQWTFVSGPNTPTIVSPSSLTTNINGLTTGNYKFRLTATDNLGASTSAEVDVKVNRLPVIVESNPSSYTNVNSFVLSFTAQDLDGTIDSVKISLAAGPSVTISHPDSNYAVITGIIPADYVFRLGAKDNTGEWNYLDLFIEVRPEISIKIKRAGKAKQVN